MLLELFFSSRILLRQHPSFGRSVLQTPPPHFPISSRHQTSLNAMPRAQFTFPESDPEGFLSSFATLFPADDAVDEGGSSELEAIGVGFCTTERDELMFRAKQSRSNGTLEVFY